MAVTQRTKQQMCQLLTLPAKSKQRRRIRNNGSRVVSMCIGSSDCRTHALSLNELKALGCCDSDLYPDHEDTVPTTGALSLHPRASPTRTEVG